MSPAEKMIHPGAEPEAPAGKGRITMTTFRVLAVGDVTTAAGLSYLRRRLPRLREELEADFVVVNGENASNMGITPEQAETILDAGADVITLGNHAFRQRSILGYLDDCSRILRPANFAPQLPGRGWGVYESKAGPVAVMNLIGRCDMDYNPDNPFLQVEAILPRIQTKLILVDFHAEATSEKLAMAWMLDGRVSAVWGTHTHVPTADERVLPRGTGSIADIGMTGPIDSILGLKPELSVKKFHGDLIGRYEGAPGPCKIEGALFTLDADTGLCSQVERVRVHG